jgi:hypothetical protein
MYKTIRARAVAVGLLAGMMFTAGARAAHTQQPVMPGMQSMSMSMPSDPLGVSMERMGSGTTWIPDAVSLPSRHFMRGAWDLMLHGFVFGQYDRQGGPRGQSQAGSLNWGMFMASHELAGGRFQARTMLSLDPWTVTPRGYPLLLQSGESYHGEPLRDRQHPHDFWMELGALYERPVTTHLGIEVYVAPAGEPALGPVAFMHRPSAMDVPFAPITHHWQDATHISFGVATVGLFTHDWKLEGSLFNGREPDDSRWNFDPITLDSYSGRLSYNPSAQWALSAGLFTHQWNLEGSVLNGREPNENRWDFDRITLDSYSGRLSYNPNEHWSLTAGYGFLKSPEALMPLEAVHRVAASAMYGVALGRDGQWATTAVWGANKNSAHPELSHGALVESEAILDQSNTLIGRAEFVQKSAEDLVVDTPPLGFASDQRFNVSSISLGYIREVTRLRGATLGIGAIGSINFVPSQLETAYGSRRPVGGVVFGRLRPFRSAP